MNILKSIVFLSWAFFSMGCMKNESLMAPIGVMVSEDVEVGTTVAQIIDRNGNIDLYRIIAGDEKRNFSISNSGEITTNKELSYQKCSTYNLKIETERHQEVEISIDVRKLG